MGLLESWLQSTFNKLWSTTMWTWFNALQLVLCCNRSLDKRPAADSCKLWPWFTSAGYLKVVPVGLFLGRAAKYLPFNLSESPFCPAARWESNNILPLHSHHILSYMPATELFNCLYLRGKQALLRAASVWSIIKYNATWKCIRHETRAWTSHSDFLLFIHFVSVHMLTAAVFIRGYLFYKLF